MRTILILLCAGLLQISSAWAADTNAPISKIKHPTEFSFKGGNLWDFIGAIGTAFGVDLNERATIDRSINLNSVSVPKMRMNTSPGGLDFRTVLNLYNEISRKGAPSLGRWVIEGPVDQEPQAILLVPSETKGASSLGVKAFSLPASNPEEGMKKYRTLLETVELQRRKLEDRGYLGLDVGDLRGQIDYPHDAGIVVVSGGKAYVELATAIIDALKEKTRMSDIVLPLPAQPGQAQNPDKPNSK